MRDRKEFYSDLCSKKIKSDEVLREKRIGFLDNYFNKFLSTKKVLRNTLNEIFIDEIISENKLENYKNIHVLKEFLDREDKAENVFKVLSERETNETFGSLPFNLALMNHLFDKKADDEYRTILDQYAPSEGFGLFSNFFIQNTIINWEDEVIIHFPSGSDFVKYGNGSGHISEKRYELKFNKEKLASFIEENISVKHINPNMDIRLFLTNEHCHDFFTKLTGISNKNTLLKLGNYFKENVEINIPFNVRNFKGITGVWITIYKKNFVIDTIHKLSYKSRIRTFRS